MVFDMVAFCKDFHIDYTFEGKNVSRGWMGLQDVFSSGDEGYHLGWNLSGNYLYSWKTGGHSLRSYLSEVAPHTPYDTLIERYGDEYAFVERMRKVPKAKKLDFDFPELNDAAKKYLAGRGFDPEYVASRYGLRWGGLFGPWRYRIIAPIYQDGQLVSYQGRTISKVEEMRYKFLPVEESVVDPKKCLWGLDECKKRHVLVTEGIYDAMKLGDDAVAVMGISTTEVQARKLSRFDTVYFLYDPEPDAQRRAKKFASQVASLGHSTCMIIDTEEMHDLGDTPLEGIRALRARIGV